MPAAAASTRALASAAAGDQRWERLISLSIRPGGRSSSIATLRIASSFPHPRALPIPRSPPTSLPFLDLLLASPFPILVRRKGDVVSDPVESRRHRYLV